jgi:hypothetical protein
MRNILPPVVFLVVALAWVAAVSASQNQSIDRAHAAMQARR